VANKETKLQIVIDAANNANSAFASLGKDLDSVSKQTKDLRTGMMAVGTAGTAAFVGLSAIGFAAVKAGADFEQTGIAFRTMIGDAGVAQQTLNELSQFAARTPFELPQLEQASKQLLAYGITAKDLIPTLHMLGDISAGVGMDKLPELILAFGQVQAKGHLAGQELLQFTNAGVGLAQQIQKDLGLTRDQFEKLMEAGKISSAQVTQALREMTSEGGLFFNLMDNQSASLAGLWSNLKDQFTLTARTIGTQLLPYLKPLVTQLIAVVQAIGQFAQEHPKLTAALLVGAIAFAGLLAVLLPIALALPGLIILFTGLGAVFAAVTAISAPLLLVIGAISTALILLASNGYLTKAAWQDVWLGIKEIVAEASNSVIGVVEGMINFIVDGVNQAIRAINRVIEAAQKVPGFGKFIPTIGTLDRVSLGRINTDLIASNDLAGRANPVQGQTNNVVVTGNTFLSQEVATQIGDMILGRLKLSNAL
jgi:tape measure domain-containing protein